MPINPVVREGRKRIRLPDPTHREAGSAWFVTVGCYQRGRAFEDAAFAAAVAGLLGERCAALGVGFDLWRLMPDHLHLVVQVAASERGLVGLMQDVKGRTTRLWWGHGGSGSLWKRSFHDRGLRTTKAHEDAVRFVLHNPVEAGLVADWAEYPWMGGDLISPTPDWTPSS